MYVVYDETTTDGVTERRLLEAAAEPIHVLVNRYLRGGPPSTRIRSVVATGRWRSPEGAAVNVSGLPDESAGGPFGAGDAFCLADGRLLIFRP